MPASKQLARAGSIGRCLAGIASLLCLQPATGKELEPWSKAGSWTVYMDPGDNCFIATGYTGGWTLALSRMTERKPLAIIAGPLRYRIGESPSLRWVVGDAEYSGGSNMVSAFPGGKRIVAPMPADFLTKMQTASSVMIYDSDEKIVGFTLSEMQPAIAELWRCTTELVKLDTGTGRPTVTPPIPRNLATLIISDDYPSRALVVSAAGRTRVALTISAHGLVSDCSLTGSSGNVDLDDATCRIMRSRARFTPGMDAANQATQSRYETSVLWQIPGK